MLIKSVHVRNFRCIKEAELPCESLTVLVGPNGAGKSSFLRALRLFYDTNADYSEEDFFNRDTTQPIEIRITFGDLTKREKELFRSHIKDDTLTVSKELTWPPGKGSQKYYGYIHGNPDFQQIRQAGRVTDKRRLYSELKSTPEYQDLRELPRNASGQQIEDALKEWEESNPSKLKWIRDEGQFFGFKEVGQAKLEQFTRLIFVPAVRDAVQEATEGRGAAISQLMDMVVRQTLSQRDDLNQLKDEMQKRYKEIVDPRKLIELQDLQNQLTQDLELFAPGTQVRLEWDISHGLDIPMPKANVRIRELDFESAVERAGHGTQRAFIFAILQRLSITEAAKAGSQEKNAEEASSLPNIVIAIEEPELYQHPNRIRHISQVLLQLRTKGMRDIGRIQVIYTTHSPLLVDLERFGQIRLVKRTTTDGDLPKQTRVYHATLSKVAEQLKNVYGNAGAQYTEEGIQARLRTSMTPWTNEGFFSNLVVLVEGEEDRAAILGQASLMEYDFDGTGISVIPVNGKTNLLKVAAVFKSFEIPVYLIWDSDEGKQDPKVDTNRALCRFVGRDEEDFPEGVETNHACFKTNLTKKMREELGEQLWQELFDECRNQLGYDSVERVKKNPDAIKWVLKEAKEKHKKGCSTLEDIVRKIVECREGSNG